MKLPLLSATAFFLALAPLRSQVWLSRPCANVDAPEGVERVLFPIENEIGMGISTDRLTFRHSDSIYLGVWVSNESDRPYDFATCSSLIDWGVNIFDSLGNRLLSAGEKAAEGGRTSVWVCFGNISITVPSHSCLVVPNLLPLSPVYSLIPGTYAITERRSGKSAGMDPKLVISVVD